MDKFLETVMNFINENTTLLIIICIFLILVLIGYLIDNGIKTRRLEKQMVNDDNSIDNSNSVQEEPTIEETLLNEKNVEVKEEEPVISQNTEANVEFTMPEEIETKPEVEEKKDDISSNEIVVDPAINELLQRDFTNNGIQAVDQEIDEPTEEVTINPIETVTPFEPVSAPEEPVPEVPSFEPSAPEKAEESIYKNDKKLSDIFKKKPVSEEPKLEKTEDYSNELDKILKKLNETSSSKDSTLEDTTDFTNMF